MSDFKNIFKVVDSEQAEAPAPASGGIAQERIKRDVENNRILIYMKGTPDMPQCGFSAATVDVFNQLGVPYETRDVLQDPEVRQGLIGNAELIEVGFGVFGSGKDPVLVGNAALAFPCRNFHQPVSPCCNINKIAAGPWRDSRQRSQPLSGGPAGKLACTPG